MGLSYPDLSYPGLILLSISDPLGKLQTAPFIGWGFRDGGSGCNGTLANMSHQHHL